VLDALFVMLVIAAVAATGGIVFGIVVLAPRLTRLIDRHEESRDEPD
jgi:hypothetical protein